MKRLDCITASVMLALAVVVVVGTHGLEFWDEYGPSSRFMPVWVAGVTALLATFLAVGAVRRVSDEAVAWPDRPGAVRVLLTFASIIGFIAVVPWLGFVLATAAFVLVMLLGVERRAASPSLFTAALTAFLIQAVFVQWLGIALPKSALGI